MRHIIGGLFQFLLAGQKPGLASTTNEAATEEFSATIELFLIAWLHFWKSQWTLGHLAAFSKTLIWPQTCWAREDVLQLHLQPSTTRTTSDLESLGHWSDAGSSVPFFLNYRNLKQSVKCCYAILTFLRLKFYWYFESLNELSCLKPVRENYYRLKVMLFIRLHLKLVDKDG